jgi:hypothetical protein
MAHLSENPERNYSAGDDESINRDLDRLMAEPAARLEDLFDNPAIREHVGKLIVKAILQRGKSGRS